MVALLTVLTADASALFVGMNDATCIDAFERVFRDSIITRYYRAAMSLHHADKSAHQFSDGRPQDLRGSKQKYVGSSKECAFELHVWLHRYGVLGCLLTCLRTFHLKSCIPHVLQIQTTRTGYC